MATLIAGGIVVNATGSTPADVLVEGERVTAVLDPNSDLARTLRRSDVRSIDASDRYVVPGGVDVHVHLQLPMTSDSTSSDTFETGTTAAVWGGTTTIIDFAGQPRACRSARPSIAGSQRRKGSAPSTMACTSLWAT